MILASRHAVLSKYVVVLMGQIVFIRPTLILTLLSPAINVFIAIAIGVNCVVNYAVCSGVSFNTTTDNRFIA